MFEIEVTDGNRQTYNRVMRLLREASEGERAETLRTLASQLRKKELSSEQVELRLEHLSGE